MKKRTLSIVLAFLMTAMITEPAMVMAAEADSPESPETVVESELSETPGLSAGPETFAEESADADESASPAETVESTTAPETETVPLVAAEAPNPAEEPAVATDSVISNEEPAPITVSADTEIAAVPDNESEDVVWLHVVHGNFSGNYNGKEISADPSVMVKLEEGRILPEDVAGIQVSRTNGTFKGWYTQSATEVTVTKSTDDQSFSVWSTQDINGDQIKPGEPVPEDVTVLYAVFDDKSESEINDADKLVTYYLDWNGINGMYGNCLTCIRSYKEGDVYFTPNDAAVFSLNYSADFDSQFQGNDEAKWEALKDIWENNTFNGYKFKGWSTQPSGGETIWENTRITDGMVFYAQWEKGDLSSETFERIDPDSKPLEFIRIAGEGLSSSLSISKHAKKGERITLTMLRNPIRAEAKDVTWKLTFAKNAFQPETTISVKAGDMQVWGGLHAVADGYTLTLTNTDGKEYGLTVDVTAKSAGENSVSLAAPAKASVGFFHNWDKGVTTKAATCEDYGMVHYTCNCGEQKDVRVVPLEHVYEKKLTNDRCCKIIKQPTCTQDGEKQFKCLRCGKLENQTYRVPATGHSWHVTSGRPLNCYQTEYTDTCSGCGQTRTRVVSASNPTLHKYSENIIPMNCSKATLVKTCTECGSVTTTTIDYKNSTGAHVWGNWKTTTAPTTESTGLQTRTCNLCGKAETRVLGQLVAGGWQNVGGEEYYVDARGEVKTGWQDLDGQWYYFNENGEMQTGWINLGNARYYLNTSGAMTTGWLNLGGTWYYLNGSGEMQTDWQMLNGTWYYFNNNGGMQTGWTNLENTRYYFDGNGKLQTGWLNLGGTWYYLNGSGEMATGWQMVDGTWYYLNSNGAMATGWQMVDGTWYYLAGSGAMATDWLNLGGTWYYLTGSGAMATGWLNLGGTWYYLTGSGAMAANTWVGNCYVNGSGAWVY